MSAPLVNAAVRACITLSSAIESANEARSGGHDLALEIVSELQSDLLEAYNLLTNQLSIELDLDARQLVRDLIVADVESSRAIIFAQTGLRLPLGKKA
ncbi:hypothetical protein [Rugamonas sp.]|uniref:hypothetical protein n=1 Tax=Rugamonas sp. TaxID=1926287 RepID=UPI0025E73D60|nr:hypothetical protein [Rugamonas sp.]